MVVANKTRHARIRDYLISAIAKADKPLTVQEWYDAVDAEAKADGFEWTDYFLEPTGKNPGPAWKTATRVILNGLHHDGEYVVRLGQGVYVPLSLSPDDLDDLDDLDDADERESSPEEKGYVYAYCLPMAPGMIKIGETGDITKRMQQHILQHAKAHIPDRPILVRAWKVSEHKAAEKAIHGVLGLRGQFYKGSGSGREWFVAEVEDIEEILNFAAPGQFEEFNAAMSINEE